jgi:hypothetical protein
VLVPAFYFATDCSASGAIDHGCRTLGSGRTVGIATVVQNARQDTFTALDLLWAVTVMDACPVEVFDQWLPALPAVVGDRAQHVQFGPFGSVSAGPIQQAATPIHRLTNVPR